MHCATKTTTYAMVVKSTGDEPQAWSPACGFSSRQTSGSAATARSANVSLTARRSGVDAGGCSGVWSGDGLSETSVKPGESASNVSCAESQEPADKVARMYELIRGFKGMGFSNAQVLEILHVANNGERSGSGLSSPATVSTVSSSKYRSEVRRANFESKAARLAQQEGYCYLLLFRYSRRQPASEIYGSNPTLSSLLGAPVTWFAFRLWDKLVLLRDGLQCHLVDADIPGQTFAQAMRATAAVFGRVVPTEWCIDGVEPIGSPLPVTARLGMDTQWERATAHNLSRGDWSLVEALRQSGAMSPMKASGPVAQAGLDGSSERYYTLYVFTDFVEEETDALSYLCYDLDRTRVVLFPRGFRRRCVVRASYETFEYVRMYVDLLDLSSVLSCLQSQGFYKGMYMSNVMQKLYRGLCSFPSSVDVANPGSHDAYAYALLYNDYQERKVAMRDIGPHPRMSRVYTTFRDKHVLGRLVSRGGSYSVNLGQESHTGDSSADAVLHGVSSCCTTSVVPGPAASSVEEWLE